MLFAACFFFSFSAFSQANFKKGQVFTAQGDTLQGFIDYREWLSNPAQIDFTVSLQNPEPRSFTPQTARGFVVDGYEKYEAHLISISQDEVDLAKIKDRIDSTSITAGAFLEVVVNGDKLKLYRFKDSIKQRYYVLSKGETTPSELKYQAYKSGIDLITIQGYKNQLAALAIKHNIYNLTPLIQTVNYNETRLSWIVAKINGTTVKKLSMGQKKKPASRWFVATGLNYSTAKYQGRSDLTLSGYNITNGFTYYDQVVTHSMLPGLAMGWDACRNQAVQRFLFRAELDIAPVRSVVKSQYAYPQPARNPADPIQNGPKEQLNTFTLSYVAFSARPQIIFNAYNGKDFKWYLGGGGNFSYREFLQNKRERTTIYLDNTREDTTTEDVFETEPFGAGFILRTGVVVNRKIELSLSYSSTSRVFSKFYQAKNQDNLDISLFQLSGGYLISNF